jgi:hypothetical protein
MTTLVPVATPEVGSHVTVILENGTRVSGALEWWGYARRPFIEVKLEHHEPMMALGLTLKNR